MYMLGIIKGQNIELTHKTGIPDGMTIVANIQILMPTFKEQQNLVDKLCGTWKNDPNIANIFTEIDEQRLMSLPRDITFDLSS